jgi:hypothetical protein
VNNVENTAERGRILPAEKTTIAQNNLYISENTQEAADAAPKNSMGKVIPVEFDNYRTNSAITVLKAEEPAETNASKNESYDRSIRFGSARGNAVRQLDEKTVEQLNKLVKEAASANGTAANSRSDRADRVVSAADGTRGKSSSVYVLGRNASDVGDTRSETRFLGGAVRTPAANIAVRNSYAVNGVVGAAFGADGAGREPVSADKQREFSAEASYSYANISYGNSAEYGGREPVTAAGITSAAARNISRPEALSSLLIVQNQLNHILSAKKYTEFASDKSNNYLRITKNIGKTENSSTAEKTLLLNTNISYRSVDNSANMVVLVPPVQAQGFGEDNGYMRNLPPIDLRQSEPVPEQRQEAPAKPTINEKMEARRVKTEVHKGFDELSRADIAKLADAVFDKIETRIIMERRRSGF